LIDNAGKGDEPPRAPTLGAVPGAERVLDQ
jgi:hypothetical protein